MLNVHPSLIPRWRGAAPIERALMAGDADHGRDDHAGHRRASTPGQWLWSRRFRSRRTTTTRVLSAKLAELGGELLVRALDGLEAGDLEFTEQDDAHATYAEKVSADERHLLPSRPAAELERIVRALTPHVGAYLELEGGDRLGVRAAPRCGTAPRRGAIEVRRRALVLGYVRRWASARGRPAAREEADERGRFPAWTRPA